MSFTTPSGTRVTSRPTVGGTPVAASVPKPVLLEIRQVATVDQNDLVAVSEALLDARRFLDSIGLADLGTKILWNDGTLVIIAKGDRK